MQSTRPPIHVWQDNETENDLLGFDVHADLIRTVITDQSVLPVTVGVFGDWGGGKSSIMKMLQKALSNDQDIRTLCASTSTDGRSKVRGREVRAAYFNPDSARRAQEVRYESKRLDRKARSSA